MNKQGNTMAAGRLKEQSGIILLEIQSELEALRLELRALKESQQRMMLSSLNRLYSAREIAEMISPGVHYQTVLQWIRDGRLIPTEGKKVSGWELERFLKESTKYHWMSGV